MLASGKVATAEIEASPLFTTIEAMRIDVVNICSVASAQVNAMLVARLQKLTPVVPCFFKVQAQCAGVYNSYQDPSKMGADRWLASIAAKGLYPNQLVCVADCGSAINIEFISLSGRHRGGYIVPGLVMMQQSLLSNTAKIDSSADALSLRLGVDTGENVSNGSLFAVVAVIEKLQRTMDQENGLLLIAGGDAHFLEAHVQARNVVFCPELVLDGFKFLR